MTEQKKVELTEEQKRIVRETILGQTSCQTSHCWDCGYAIATAVLAMPEAPTERRFTLEEVGNAINHAAIYTPCGPKSAQWVWNHVRFRLLAPKPVEKETPIEEIAKILGRAETNGDSFNVTASRIFNFLHNHFRAELAKQEGA